MDTIFRKEILKTIDPGNRISAKFWVKYILEDQCFFMDTILSRMCAILNSYINNIGGQFSVYKCHPFHHDNEKPIVDSEKQVFVYNGQQKNFNGKLSEKILTNVNTKVGDIRGTIQDVRSAIYILTGFSNCLLNSTKK